MIPSQKIPKDLLFRLGSGFRRILDPVLDDPALPDMQPYFTHFALEAVWKAGLFSKYGLKLLRRWDEMTAATGKGLQEGWVKPEEGYAFDYSHAWGGTPAYQLPMRLLGLEMLEPGYRRIRLVPRLYGLNGPRSSCPPPTVRSTAGWRTAGIPSCASLRKSRRRSADLSLQYFFMNFTLKWLKNRKSRIK